MPKPAPQQQELFDHSDSDSLFAAFKQVYFHLYSNGASSRAERIFDDLAKILILLVLSQSAHKHEAEITAALECKDPRSKLIRILVQHFPDYFADDTSFALEATDVARTFATLGRFPVNDAPGQLLADAFQSIVGPSLRGDKGQFFTPVSVVKAMVDIAAPTSGCTVIDPAAGTGNFLIEAFQFLQQRDQTRACKLIGLEKERDLQRVGGAFCHLITRGHARILCRNSLSLLDSDPDQLLGTADFVLTNPPFGANIKIKDKGLLQAFSLGHSWHYSAHHGRFFEQPKVAVGQDPQILFVELCLKLLKPDGLMGIILPEGLFGNRGSQYVWDFVKDHCVIEYLIDCPRTTFQPGTDTKTNIVFLSRKKTKRQPSPLVAVAEHCGHDRRGRTITKGGQPFRDDFAGLGADLRNGMQQWRKVTLSHPDYLVPRFYYNQALTENTDGVWPYAISQVRSVGDLVKDGLLKVRKGHEVGSESYGSGDIPFIRTSDIHNWEVTSSPTNSVSEEIYERYRSLQNLKAHDILLVVDGRYRIGRAAILHATNIRCIVQSHIRILTLDPNELIEPFELLYALGLPQVVRQIRNLTFVQSTLASVGKRLSHLQIPIFAKTDPYTQIITSFRTSLEQRALLLNKLDSFELSEAEI
jgi:type I restriction enzyme M protein